MPGQWWAVLNGRGVPVSEGSVVANPLPTGLVKVAVDGPSGGRPWDPQAQAWGPAPPPAAASPDIVASLAQIAADQTLTADQFVAAVRAVLAQAAPTT